jgi:hypothetical protein
MTYLDFIKAVRKKASNPLAFIFKRTFTKALTSLVLSAPPYFVPNDRKSLKLWRQRARKHWLSKLYLVDPAWPLGIRIMLWIAQRAIIRFMEHHPVGKEYFYIFQDRLTKAER